jgi:hypothetical protein
MNEEATMRARLQNVAAYRELRRSVQRSGRENVVFALVMLGLAYYTFQPNGVGIAAIVFMLYVGLALAEFAVGLFKVLAPSAEGILLDALILLLFAGWNLGWQALAFMLLPRPNIVIVIFGLYMLMGAFARFKNYLQLRKMFAERPAREHIVWFDDLVHEVQISDPLTDPSALDLPTQPHWKAKLLGGTAFFVSANGNAVWVVGPEEFTLKREKTDRGKGYRKALLSIHGEGYPEFEIDDVSWENYAKWMASQPTELLGERGA